MKKIYTVLLLCVCAVTSHAQTQPAAQALPYQQNFSSLTSGVTAYPDGWQGWTVASSTSTSFRTNAPTGDKPLVNGTAASTAGATYNYSERIGFLNSGSSGDQSLVLALNSTGNSNIGFAYDIMTMRNPYGGSNSRINEVILQYRVGSSGDFTSISGTEYQNNTENQQAGTTPQHVVSANIVLPEACNNQPLVQLRWISREVSGGGSRPGFAVDNISAGSGGGSDTTKPSIQQLTPASNAVDVLPATMPSIQFNEPVVAGTGNIILHNLTLHTSQTLAVSSAAVTIAANTLTIHASLQPLSNYYIHIDSAAVTDASGNAFNGIADSLTWNFTTASQQLSFGFNDCAPVGSTLLAGGFKQVSQTGAQTWACTSFGQTGNAVQINGFANGNAQDNDDWLISPAFDFSGFNYPLLTFSSRSAFAGPGLRLMLSTDYNGTGNPADFNWTEINGRFPEVASDVWTASKDINLAAYKQAGVYIAFVYHSSLAEGASRWTIDDVSVVNSDTLPAPGFISSPALLSFDYVAAGNVSSPQPWKLTAYNLRGAITLTAPAGFNLSADSLHFSSSLTLPGDSIESKPLNLYARFAPTQPNLEYQGKIGVASTALNADAAELTGSSLRALKVVNWNIEWFGSPVNGPANDSLQQQNVLTVLRNLGADIYALAEVVDTARLKQVVSNLGGYSYTISDYGSYADSLTDVDYAGAQKLAFVYKNGLIKKIRTYGVLRKNGSTDAYFNWSSGRFPYLMEAEVMLNGKKSIVNFVLLHSKANTGTTAEKIEAYQRRKAGAEELKDTLDKYYPYKNFIILGDFNDALNKTITTELAPDTTTSYISYMNDSVHYKPLTLPLSLAGLRSTVGNENVIDNVIASNEMAIAYVSKSAQVLQSVTGWISNYGNTTTDHYPVVSRYDISYLAKPVELVQFAAKANAGNVELNWRTGHEINSASFIVERSFNNRWFTPVDTLAAQGDKREATDYKTYDNKPLPGRSYYRLKQVSLDGSISYSAVQSVKWKPCIKVLVLGKWITIELCKLEDGKGEIQIIDITGRIRKTIPLNSFKGYTNLRFNCNLPLGIYFLRIVRPGDVDATQIFLPGN